MSKEHRVAVRELINLVNHSLLHSLILVPNTGNGRATCCIPDGVTIGEFDVIALC